MVSGCLDIEELSGLNIKIMLKNKKNKDYWLNKIQN